MNIMQFKSKVKEYTNSYHSTTQQVIQNYMFERFLERLSKSKYKNNFVIKGGCLLSSLMGIDIRSTRDIDMNVIGIPLRLEEMKSIINEIIEIDLDDNIQFNI